MREGIHPTYREVVFRDAASGATFKTRSTMDSNQTVEWEDGKTYPLVDRRHLGGLAPVLDRQPARARHRGPSGALPPALRRPGAPDAREVSTGAGAGVSDWRSRKRDETRERIYSVAMRLFDEHGFERVSVGQIAAAAGVSVPTFYSHFASKEQVVIVPISQRTIDELVGGQPEGLPRPSACAGRCTPSSPATAARSATPCWRVGGSIAPDTLPAAALHGVRAHPCRPRGGRDGHRRRGRPDLGRSGGRRRGHPRGGHLGGPGLGGGGRPRAVERPARPGVRGARGTPDRPRGRARGGSHVRPLPGMGRIRWSSGGRREEPAC